MTDDNHRPGEGNSSGPAAGPGAGPRSTSNGTGKGHAAGNGQRNPFDDVDGQDGENDDWQHELPTEAEVKAKPSSIYAVAKLRALAKLRDTNLEESVDLIRRLVAAAQDCAVTRAKVDAEVTKQARRDRQEAKAEADTDDGDKENVVDALIRLGRHNTELFHALDGQAYATVAAGGSSQTVRISGRTFLEILLNRYMHETGRGVSGDALRNAAMNLTALARRKESPRHSLFPRIGTQNGNIYVDRGSDRFDAYEIQPAKILSDGTFQPVWRLIPRPPVKFIRPEGASIGELPIAKQAAERELDHDDDIEALRPFLPVPDGDPAFELTVGWVLGCYTVSGDKAAAVVAGDGGSGKTSLGRFACALVDPLPPDATDDGDGRRGHMRAPSADPWDSALSAQATLVQTYDNLSEIDARTADIFCRFSTGGSTRRRSLYGLLDETVLSARRPVLLTAVQDLVVRGDLASRCIFLRAGRGPDAARADEARLWQAFEAVWPGLLGSIFDAVSVGLANQLPDMADPPRLAHFANWVRQCEVGLRWQPGTFLTAYTDNQVEGSEIVADADPVVTAVRDFAAKEAEKSKTRWPDIGLGTPTDLYEQLELQVSYLGRRVQTWPKRPAELSKRLRSSVSTLARLGVQVEFGRRTNTAAQLALSWPGLTVAPPPSGDAAAPPETSGSVPAGESNLGVGTASDETAPTPKQFSGTGGSAGKNGQSVGSVGSVGIPSLLSKKEEREGEVEKGLPLAAGRRLVARL